VNPYVPYCLFKISYIVSVAVLLYWVRERAAIIKWLIVLLQLDYRNKFFSFSFKHIY